MPENELSKPNVRGRLPAAPLTNRIHLLMGLTSSDLRLLAGSGRSTVFLKGNLSNLSGSAIEVGG